jgi:hypothetical protein
MAIVPLTKVSTGNSKVIARSWVGMTQGDVGVKFDFSQYSDKTVHAYGDFGTGATVAMRGSNKPNADESTPSDWFPLTDVQANAITKTSPAAEVIAENPLWISPSLGAATDASANIDITLNGKE